MMMTERLFFNLVNFIEIEISSLCNRDCSYCVQPLAQRKRELLSLKVVEKIATELGHIGFNGGIAFHQYNEPLLEKEHLFACIKVIKDNIPEAKLVLYTNGDLLTYKLFRKLIDVGIDEFHISCHGNGDKEWSKEMGIKEVRKMKRKIHHYWGKWNVENTKVAFLPNWFRELVFKNKMYRFIHLHKYPYIVYIDSTNYFENGSQRMGKLDAVKAGNGKCIVESQMYLCQSMMHSMHISYKGNAYLCWDCCEGIKESERYCLGSIYKESIFELFRKKCQYIKEYMFGEEMFVCKKCFWNK